MLKIKDDVDLKELEKFGFEPRYNERTGKIYKYIACTSIKDQITKTNTNTSISDVISDVFVWEIHIQNLMLLFDLIQAGLVEKG